MPGNEEQVPPGSSSPLQTFFKRQSRGKVVGADDTHPQKEVEKTGAPDQKKVPPQSSLKKSKP